MLKSLYCENTEICEIESNGVSLVKETSWSDETLPCLLIAGRASMRRWTARELHWAMERNILLVSIRISSCQHYWWADKSQRWACDFECRSSAPDLQEDSVSAISCCGSSSAHRLASFSAPPSSFGLVVKHRECLIRYAALPRKTWSYNLSRRCQCDWWLVEDGLQRLEPAGSSRENLEWLLFVESCFVDAEPWSWCPRDWLNRQSKSRQPSAVLELTWGRTYQPSCPHYHIKALGNGEHIPPRCREVALKPATPLFEESIRTLIAEIRKKNVQIRWMWNRHVI